MNAFEKYWEIYGGWKQLFQSKYLLFSILISGICYRLWSGNDWCDLVISIMPAILGFSLGGYAIFLGFGDRGFQQEAAESDEGGQSLYLEASATFFHFILVQIMALVYAVIAKSLPIMFIPKDKLPDLFWKAQSYGEILGSGLGFLLLVYAIMTALAASVALFNLSIVYHKWLEVQSSKSKIGSASNTEK